MKRVCVFGLDYAQDIWLHNSWVVFEHKTNEMCGRGHILAQFGDSLGLCSFQVCQA